MNLPQNTTLSFAPTLAKLREGSDAEFCQACKLTAHLVLNRASSVPTTEAQNAIITRLVQAQGQTSELAIWNDAWIALSRIPVSKDLVALARRTVANSPYELSTLSLRGAFEILGLVDSPRAPADPMNCINLLTIENLLNPDPLRPAGAQVISGILFHLIHGVGGRANLSSVETAKLSSCFPRLLLPSLGDCARLAWARMEDLSGEPAESILQERRLSDLLIATAFLTSSCSGGHLSLEQRKALAQTLSDNAPLFAQANLHFLNIRSAPTVATLWPIASPFSRSLSDPNCYSPRFVIDAAFYGVLPDDTQFRELPNRPGISPHEVGTIAPAHRALALLSIGNFPEIYRSRLAGDDSSALRQTLEGDDRLLAACASWMQARLDDAVTKEHLITLRDALRGAPEVERAVHLAGRDTRLAAQLFGQVDFVSLIAPTAGGGLRAATSATDGYFPAETRSFEWIQSLSSSALASLPRDREFAKQVLAVLADDRPPRFGAAQERKIGEFLIEFAACEASPRGLLRDSIRNYGASVAAALLDTAGMNVASLDGRTTEFLLSQLAYLPISGGAYSKAEIAAVTKIVAESRDLGVKAAGYRLLCRADCQDSPAIATAHQALVGDSTPGILKPLRERWEHIATALRRRDWARAWAAMPVVGDRMIELHQQHIALSAAHLLKRIKNR